MMDLWEFPKPAPGSNPARAMEDAPALDLAQNCLSVALDAPATRNATLIAMGFNRAIGRMLARWAAEDELKAIGGKGRAN